MEFDKLLKLVGNEPVFDSSLLLAGNVQPEYIRTQLSRWVKAEKIHQLRRGVYMLAAPYQKQKPHPFLIANRLKRASYVSMQTALSFYGMIPDIVKSTISVTTGRSEGIQTSFGYYEFKHIHKKYFRGYKLIDFGDQQAFVATPEKALLDLIYLQPGGETAEYLTELRLQNLEQLNMEVLRQQAEFSDKPKIQKAIRDIEWIVNEDHEEYVNL